MNSKYFFFVLIIALCLTYGVSGEIIKLDRSGIVDGSNVKIHNIPGPLKTQADLVIEDVQFTRQEFFHNPDLYFLTFYVKNKGAAASESSNIGYSYYYVNASLPVIALPVSVMMSVDLPSIQGGNTISVKKSFPEELNGRIYLGGIEVNMADPDCSGDNCHLAKESDYDNNKWPGNYEIPDTVNSTIELVSKIVEGKDLKF